MAFRAKDRKIYKIVGDPTFDLISSILSIKCRTVVDGILPVTFETEIGQVHGNLFTFQYVTYFEVLPGDDWIAYGQIGFETAFKVVKPLEGESRIEIVTYERNNVDEWFFAEADIDWTI